MPLSDNETRLVKRTLADVFVAFDAAQAVSPAVSGVLYELGRNPALQQAWRDASRQLLDSPALQQLAADSLARNRDAIAEAFAPTTQRMVEQMSRIFAETSATTWRQLFPRDLDLDFPAAFAQLNIEQVRARAVQRAAGPEMQEAIAENPEVITAGPVGDAAKRGDLGLAAVLLMILLLAVASIWGASQNERLAVPLQLLASYLEIAMAAVVAWAVFQERKRD